MDSDSTTRSELEARIGPNYRVKSFSSAESYLSSGESLDERAGACIVSEFDLPEMKGLELQALLFQRQVIAAMVFFVDSPRCQDIVRAMQRGAYSVLEKSKGYGLIVPTIASALAECERLWSIEIRRREIVDQLKTLTDGERNVLNGIMEGQLNKEIADRLHLSIRTIEQRRHQIFHKLHVRHPASLVKKVLHATDRVAQTGQRLHESTSD